MFGDSGKEDEASGGGALLGDTDEFFSYVSIPLTSPYLLQWVWFLKLNFINYTKRIILILNYLIWS